MLQDKSVSWVSIDLCPRRSFLVEALDALYSFFLRSQSAQDLVQEFPMNTVKSHFRIKAHHDSSQALVFFFLDSGLLFLCPSPIPCHYSRVMLFHGRHLRPFQTQLVVPPLFCHRVWLNRVSLPIPKFPKSH